MARRSKFDKLASKLRRRGVRNPRALAAYIGDRKYGVKGMERKAAAARRRKRKRGR